MQSCHRSSLCVPRTGHSVRNRLAESRCEHTAGRKGLARVRTGSARIGCSGWTSCAAVAVQWKQPVPTSEPQSRHAVSDPFSAGPGRPAAAVAGVAVRLGRPRQPPGDFGGDGSAGAAGRLAGGPTRHRLLADPGDRERTVRAYHRGRVLHLLVLVGGQFAALGLLGWGWSVRTICGVDSPEKLPFGAESSVIAPFLIGLVLSWAGFYSAEQYLALRGSQGRNTAAAGGATSHSRRGNT